MGFLMFDLYVILSKTEILHLFELVSFTFGATTQL
uniref:Uncharacterized protein n=1 Tax=Cyanothece sp. (strain PCC 7425 / ATCC 29141) TaxID=395961 RepID=B8HXZ3_CYAP4